MAMAARYGHISPLDFEEMDFDDAKWVAERCAELHRLEWEAYAELHSEIGQAIIKSNQSTVSAIARGMAS